MDSYFVLKTGVIFFGHFMTTNTQLSEDRKKTFFLVLTKQIGKFILIKTTQLFAKSLSLYLNSFFPCLQGSEVTMQNATTQYLSLLTPSQYHYLLKSVCGALPKQHREFSQDWIHETIISWCANDSFKNFLSSGNQSDSLDTTLPLLASHLKQRNHTIRNRLAKDALFRNKGFKTKDERNMSEEKQLRRVTATSPSSIAYNYSEEEVKEYSTFQEIPFTTNSFDVSCTYFNDKADIDLEIRELIEYVYKNTKGTYKQYIPQYASLYFKGMTREEISDVMGLSKDTVRNISRMFQTVAREGREKGLI